MARGEAIAKGGAALTPWLTATCAGLSAFIVWAAQQEDATETGAGSADGNASKPSESKCRGIEALKKHYKEVVRKDVKTLKIQDLTLFTTWRHLLDETQCNGISTLRNTLMKSGTAAKPKSEASKPSKPVKPKAKSKDAQLDATARALLGLK
eukprot:5982491-Amphidinium_carterae.2